MVKCTGKSVLKGIAVGRVYVYRKQEYTLKQTQIEDVQGEARRFGAGGVGGKGTA